MISWFAARTRPKASGTRLRQISLALALVFAQVLDPPTQHMIEAKETKGATTPSPGDPPPPGPGAKPRRPSAQRRRRPRR